MVRITQIRGWSGQATSWAAARPSFIARVASWLLLVFFAIVLGVVLLPIVVIAILLMILWLAVRTLRRLFSVAREPNGPLDGRRNVRVVTPRTAEDTLGNQESSEA